MGNFSVVVLDFETTGLSPENGDRAIEVGAVLLQDNRVVDRFQSLMNPGMRVSGFIENYTGITNQMLKSAPPVEEVMRQFADFIAPHYLVAHNASFDRRFLESELRRIKKPCAHDFACSLLISRRVYPDAPSHSLESLVSYKKLKTDGVHHRALADAEMTGHLWINMINDLKTSFKLSSVPFQLMQQLATVSKAKTQAFLAQCAKEQEKFY